MNQRMSNIDCNAKNLKDFCDAVLNMTGDKFRKCKRGVYSVHVWKAPAGYVFANKFEQPESYNAIMKEYKKPIVPVSIVEKNPQAMVFLKQNGCYVTDGTRIVICGTAGEMWTVKPEKLVSSYVLENGNNITAQDLYSNRWVTVKRKATEACEVGIFVPVSLFIQMQFSWGKAFLNHPLSGGHYKGDILVFPADAMGNPDFTKSCSPINNSIFEATFNQSVGGWSNTGYIGDDQGKAPSINALNSLIVGTPKIKSVTTQQKKPSLQFAYANPLYWVKTKEGIFRIYGTVELETQKSDSFIVNNKALPTVNMPVIEFYDLKATIEVNGVEQPYTPKAVTFSGKRLDVYDMADQVTFACITRSTEYIIDAVDDSLMKYLKFWREFKTLNLNNNIVTQFICKDGYVYSLCAATTKYLYYTYYDGGIAMTIDTKEILTTVDEFVLEAMTESADAVAAGKEKILFGDLSKYVSE